MWLIEGALEPILISEGITLEELAKDILDCSIEEAKLIISGETFVGSEQKKMLFAAFGDDVMQKIIDWEKSKI